MTTPRWQDLARQSFEEHVRKRIRAKTKNQEAYLRAIEASVVTFCIGPAGTGKSFVACGMAIDMLRDKKVSRIILTRPLVTCSGRNGKGIGFLPGELDEKVGPYMRPLLDAFEEFIAPEELQSLLMKKTIEMWPMDMMRGASIKNAIIIADEAQNAEFEQLYMLLTRFGEGSKLIITGDVTRKQTDLQQKGPIPLAEIIRRLERNGGHKDIAIVRLTREDVLRHPLIVWIDERLSAPEKGKGSE